MEPKNLERNNMNHVSKLDLKEFRGIRECAEPLSLAKFNVLVGRNNSGKSAILQALSVLPHPELPAPMGLSVASGSTKKALLHHLTGGTKSVVYKYSGAASLDFQLDKTRYVVTLDEHGNAKAAVGEKEIATGDIPKYFPVTAQEAHNWSVFIPNESDFLGSVRSVLSTQWARIVKSKAHIAIARDIINPTINEKFTEMLRDDSSLKVRKEISGEPFYIDVRDLGDGVEKALCICLFLELCRPALVLWDDFEAFAHPSLLRTLLGWLAGKDWQIVLSTHSMDTLFEMSQLKPKRAQVIQLKKTPEDVLFHKTLTMDDLSDLVGTGTDPRLLVDLVA
ncbi:MAG: AAA family ATPase [Chloroflexi bacterium]|nr:AAA family ATPase [Chloroflexota bacterium]